MNLKCVSVFFTGSSHRTAGFFKSIVGPKAYTQLQPLMTSIKGSKGMLKNTVIIYTADNGGPIATSVVAAKGASMEDGIGASNWPLRGGG